MTTNVVVAIRVRPGSANEKCCVSSNSGATSCDVTVPARGTFGFSFDHIFRYVDGQTNEQQQRDVFLALGQPLVRKVALGFNASLIAYGASGSGKTHTVFGFSTAIGLTQRMATELLSLAPGNATLRLGIVECYMEEVFDLLDQRRPLRVRGDSQNGFSIDQRMIDLMENVDLVRALAAAEFQKTVASTGIHDRSSRAHTLVVMEYRSFISAAESRVSKLVVADLAGSERAKMADTTNFSETNSINLSLLTFGACIETIAQRGRSTDCRPPAECRNSVLTKLLKDSMGGSSLCTLIGTVNASERDASISLQTLRFVDRVKHIQCSPQLVAPCLTDLTERIRSKHRARVHAIESQMNLELAQHAYDRVRQQLASTRRPQHHIDELTSQLTALGEKVQECQQELKDNGSELPAVAEFLDFVQVKHSDEIRTLTQQVSSLQLELNGHKQQNSLLQKELVNANEAFVSAQMKTVENEEQSIAALANSAKCHELAMCRLQAALTEHIDEHSRQISDRQHELDKVRLQNIELRASLHDFEQGYHLTTSLFRRSEILLDESNAAKKFSEAFHNERVNRVQDLLEAATAREAYITSVCSDVLRRKVELELLLEQRTLDAAENAQRRHILEEENGRIVDAAVMHTGSIGRSVLAVQQQVVDLQTQRRRLETQLQSEQDKREKFRQELELANQQRADMLRLCHAAHSSLAVAIGDCQKQSRTPLSPLKSCNVRVS